MKRRLTALILTLGLVSGLAACGTTGQTTPTGEAPLANDPGVSYENFLSAASADYAYDVALELSTNPDFFNSELGGRNAGSDAEHATADYLAGLMEEIGLSDVEKAAADCDRWQFNGASLTIGEKEYPVYSYATASTPLRGSPPRWSTWATAPCGTMRAYT